MKICAVFDIDDTLYLERDYVRSGFDAVGQWGARWFGESRFAELCWAKFMAGQRNSIFDSVLSELQVHSGPELVSALVMLYRSHRPAIQLADDAREALDAISEAASIAVISDGPMIAQSRKAEALRVSGYASTIVLTEVFGTEFSKPHPKAFEYVMERHRAPAYVYIADNPLKDFIAPQRLGWATVRVRRAGGLHYDAVNGIAPPDVELSDCSDLPAVLAGF